jgi:hypothetical protein
VKGTTLNVQGDARTQTCSIERWKLNVGSWKSSLSAFRAPLVLLALSLSLLSGCLKFGNDQELLAPKVTATHLQQVSTLTGINFPAGTTGVAYLYFGSGIDDSLALKAEVPPEQKDTFLKNDAFLKGTAEPPHLQIGRGRAWWKLDTLKNAMHRKVELPKGRFAEISLGLEDGKLVAYISWICT